MQRRREDRNNLFDMGDSFSIFGAFGSPSNMIPRAFGGRDPFDDPFFTRPFGSLFESSMHGQSSLARDISLTDNSKGIVIEELDSDHEGEKEDGGSGDSEMHSRSSKEPSVEHPDDDDDGGGGGRNEDVKYKNQHGKVQGSQAQGRSFSFQNCKVTYGGVDGAYYTSSRTRRAGNDGVVLEESKEADRTTGQATHRISRGINDKGHSFTRKLYSDGKVDTHQTLHNLNEDELTGFEKAWKGNANQRLGNWSDRFDMDCDVGSSQDEQMGRPTRGAWALPSSEQSLYTGGTTLDNNGRRTKKVVRINID